MTDLAVYVLVRNDLPSMNPGKAMSQCHHAGVQMMGRYGNHALVKEYISAGMAQGANWFNTTLVLTANEKEIGDTVMNIARLDGVLCGEVVDPSYPFAADGEIARLLEKNPKITRVKTFDNGMVLLTREELTCVWFLVDRDNTELGDLFARFSLHP